MISAAAKRLGSLLADSGRSLSVAESCTGGLVAGAITSIPGSSRYFRGGVVAYHNSVKTSLLHVPPDLIAGHGAVSREVALAMAEGVLSRFRADLAIAVTGVAGLAEMCFLHYATDELSCAVAVRCARRGLLFKRTAYNFVSLAHDEGAVDRALEILDETLGGAAG